LALEEAGVAIDCLAGTSSGAIIAALYAYGYSAKELIDMVPTITKRYLDYDYRSLLLRMFNPKIKIRGLIRGERLRNLISSKTNNAMMSDLKYPVVLLSADMKQARQVLITSRPLPNPGMNIDMIMDIGVAEAVQSSFAIPGLFQPLFYHDRVLVDGGLLNNCPINAVRSLGAEKVIAVDLTAADPVQSSFDSISSILMRAISMNLSMQAKEVTRDADILLKPEVVSAGMLDFSNLESGIESGYEYTRYRMSEIKDALALSEAPEAGTPV
jgi:NTE family protein